VMVIRGARRMMYNLYDGIRRGTIPEHRLAGDQAGSCLNGTVAFAIRAM